MGAHIAAIIWGYVDKRPTKPPERLWYNLEGALVPGCSLSLLALAGISKSYKMFHGYSVLF